MNRRSRRGALIAALVLVGGATLLWSGLDGPPSFYPDETLIEHQHERPPVGLKAGPARYEQVNYHDGTWDEFDLNPPLPPDMLPPLASKTKWGMDSDRVVVQPPPPDSAQPHESLPGVADDTLESPNLPATPPSSHPLDSIPPFENDDPLPSFEGAPNLSTPAPRITFIVIWSPRLDTTDAYLPNFFASIGANPSIELLLIKIDKYGLKDGGCEIQHAAGIPNVREVCLGMEEYLAFHVAYLCDVWGCDDRERETVKRLVDERAEGDQYNSAYRPFRAEVFKKWMRPDVHLWGWCDLDMMMGNVERTFPWDLASDFDVYVGAAPSERSKVHMFMPGHMVVFRKSPEVARAFFALPEIQNVHNFETMPWIIRPNWAGCEEAEYSYTLFMLTDLTFLRFDAMVNAWHHLSTLNGVYGIELAHWMPHSLLSGPPESDDLLTTDGAFTHPAGRAVVNSVLRDREENAPRRGNGVGERKTFSDKGQEMEVQLRSDPEILSDFIVWFDEKYAVLYESPLGHRWDNNGQQANRYAMRRTRGGPVVERFEPVDYTLIPATIPHEGWVYSQGNRPWIRELMYNHYQGEKYASWYALPEKPLAQGDVLYTAKDSGAFVWDKEGKMLFQTGEAMVKEPSLEVR
ncbi:unnamed protein product [Peniophora sp. CBMAI 1063]|nr:unnamed protein product [Peniophora sp. CBMAI 1063]